MGYKEVCVCDECQIEHTLTATTKFLPYKLIVSDHIINVDDRVERVSARHVDLCSAKCVAVHVSKHFG